MRNADGQKTHLPHYEHISCTFLQRMHKSAVGDEVFYTPGIKVAET